MDGGIIIYHVIPQFLTEFMTTLDYFLNANTNNYLLFKESYINFNIQPKLV